MNSGNSITYKNIVASDLPFFADHFPGDPLVPGAVISYWVCSGFETETQTPVRHIKHIKFFKPLRPKDEYCIEYSVDHDNQTAKFICRVDEDIICKGSLEIKRHNNE